MHAKPRVVRGSGSGNAASEPHLAPATLHVPGHGDAGQVPRGYIIPTFALLLGRSGEALIGARTGYKALEDKETLHASILSPSAQP